MAEPKEIGTVWTLGCDVFIEDALTADVHEIKVNDIVLSANIFTEGLSVEVGSDMVNAMDLDVRISMDGLKTYIIDSQIVPYEEVLKITDFSPEATNEKRYASSANTSKKIIDSVGELKGRVNLAEGDIDALEKRVDDLELKGTGGSGDGFWYLNEQDGKIHTDIGIVVHGDAIFEGDTSSGGDGEDVVVGIQGVRVNGTTHYDEDGDGVVDLGTIESGGGGLTSVSWGDIQGTPPSVSTFNNDVPYVTDEELRPLGEEIELLSSMWHLDENGNLVTDKQVIIKNSLIVEQDTSSGGEGESVLMGVQGISINGGAVVYPNSEGIVELTISGGGGSADLSNYYTKSETDAIIDGTFKSRSQIISNTNADQLLTNGVYLNATGNGSGNENIPVSYSILTTFTQSNNYAAQLSIGNGVFHFRRKIDTWSDWAEVIHSGNIGSQWVDVANSLTYRVIPSDLTTIGPKTINWCDWAQSTGQGIASYSYGIWTGAPDISYGFGFGADAFADELYFKLMRGGTVGPWRRVITTSNDGYIYGLGGSIDIQYSDEINRYGGNLYLQHRGTVAGEGTGGNYTGHVIMCANGGNVLIGTTTDNSAKLQVNGNIDSFSDGEYSGVIGFNRKSAVGGLYNTAYAGWQIHNHLGTLVFFCEPASGSDGGRMVINESGNVGIGTTSPLSKLQVDGQINLSAGTNNNYSFIRSENYSSNISLLRIGTCYGYSSEASAITIYNGCVGIGKDIPEYKLDVNGQVRAEYYNLHNGAYITQQFGFLCLQSVANELCIGANGYNGIHINYRPSADGTAPQTYYWRAGSATSWSDHYVGDLYAQRSVQTYEIYLREADEVVSPRSMFGLYMWDNVVQFTRRDLNNAYQKALLELNLNNDNAYIYGNLVVSGDTSSGSDIRFKDVIKNKTLKIADIAKAPLFTFKWNDREDDTIHLGSSAQYWEKVTPWLVSGSEFKSLNYATLGVAMGISLAKKAVNHEERIKVLEKEIKRLKEEMIHG